MTDRPTIFSGPMIRALLDDRKTQTRRLATSPLAKSTPGDRLWVRETIELQGAYTDGVRVIYEASRRRAGGEAIGMCHRPPGAIVRVQAGRLSPSIHMPRWASRLTLVVTDVRPQRLNDITDEDALAEGVVWSDECLGYVVPGIAHPNKDFPVLSRPRPREMFAALWDAIHGSGAWLSNPEVAALTFAVHRRNIDQMGA